MNTDKYRFLFTLFGFERVKNIRELVFIILVHIIGWTIFLCWPLLFYTMRFEGDHFIQRELLTKLIPICLFYINYYYFLPRLFEQKKYQYYFSVVALSILLVSVSDVYIRSRIDFPFRQQNMRPAFSNGGRQQPMNDSFQRMQMQADSNRMPGPMRPFPEKKIFGYPQSMVLFSINRTISTCVFLVLLGGLIRLAYSFLRNLNEKRSLENANLNAEVNFLKSQINPHFLFNTLNSIYSQARVKSDNTADSILRLSSLLRYSLYDSGEEKVPLEKDIQYLDNYIDLQRMRISSKVALNYKVEGDKSGKMIAPLLLICFVENAFKHGISYTHPSVIDISIGIFDKTLTLHVSNPIIETNSFAEGGLGLKNVTRRLELLYPDQYKLDISRLNDRHIVTLELMLNHA